MELFMCMEDLEGEA